MAVALLGGSADGQHAHHGVAPGLGEQGFDVRAGVHARPRVRLRTHRGEAARRGRACTGGDRLGVLEAWLAQVAVEVHEAGGYDVTRDIDHRFGGYGLRLNDAPAVD